MSEVDTSTPEYADAVAKAKLLGWVPKEQFRGQESAWRDAPEFLEFGERMNPILRENNRRLEAELLASKQQIANIQKQVAEFAKLHEQTKAEAYKQALADLKMQKKEALENGDLDAVVELDEQIADTREAERQAKRAVEKDNVVDDKPQKSADPVAETIYRDWSTQPEIKLILADPEMEAYSRAIGEVLTNTREHIRETPAESFKVFLNLVAEKVKARFPEKFRNDNRAEESRVEGSGGAAKPASGKRNYAALPKEAQEACDFLVSTGTMTREQYLATYKW